MLGRPLFSTLHLSFPRGLDDSVYPGILDVEEQARVISEAESLVTEEMRLGALASDPATPSPTEQTLKAVTVADYGFSVMADSPMLVSPVGPITTLSALSIDGHPVDLTRLIVGPWALRYRDGSCFQFTSDASISAVIGWSHPGDVPFRIRSAVQLLVMDIATIHDPTAGVQSNTVDGDVETFFDPRRARVHRLVGRLVEPWTRPPSA